MTDKGLIDPCDGAWLGEYNGAYTYCGAELQNKKTEHYFLKSRVNYIFS